MKTIYSAPNLSLVSIIQNVLDQHGVNCWIKNEFLSAGIGDLPPIECWPQVCVNDEVFLEAKNIVEDALAEKTMSAWKCSSCGEELEGQFTECWKCGESRSPGESL
jgi:hypothetical protein